MVEDQPVDTEMAVRALKKNDIDFDYIRVETEKDFRNAINDYNPDLIISDYSMPMFNGMDALKIANEVCPDIPFIILTGSINEETAVECIKTGATDYLLKDNMTRLPFAVLDAIKKFENEKQKQIIEIKLTESEKRYTALFQNNHAVMILFDPENGKIIDANPAACNFYGYSQKELTSMSMPDLNKLPIHELKEKYQKALNGEINLFLVKHFLANGDERFVDVYIGPIKINERELLYSIIHDVTDRVNAENELKKREAEMKMSAKKWQDTFNSITDIVCVISIDHTFLEINEAGCKSLNLKHEQIIGRKCFELAHGTQSPLSTCPCTLSLKSGEPSSSELEQNGKFYETTAWPIFDDKNNMIAFSHSIKDITERRLAEDARIKSEAKYKFMFDNNPQPMWIYDLETLAFLEVNDAAVNQYGYSKEEFLSLTLKDIRPEEDIPQLLTDIKNTKETYNPMREWRHKKKNGEIIIVEISSHSILYNNKEARHVLVNDITARKKAEDENRVLAHALKSINDFVTITDFENKIIFANDAFLNAYGYSYDEIVGEKIDIVGSSRNAKQIHDQIAKTTFTVGYKGELWNKRKDGSEFQIYLSTTSVRSDDNKTIALVGVSNDITERKKAEQLQRIIYNISQAANTLIGLDELIIIIKEQLQLVIDIKNFYIAFYNEEDNTFTTPYMLDEKDEFKTWPAGKTLTNYVLRSEKSGLLTQNDILELNSKGLVDVVGTLPKVWMGVPLKIKGKPFGVFAVQSYDNSQAYNLNDLEMLEFISYQMSISIERKRLDNELVIAKEKAEESDRLKTSFLANISHEIRTPMNGILGFSDMLAREDLEPEKRDMFIDVIRKSGHQLLSIVDDIIDIAKIETGQIQLTINAVSLDEVMEYLYELYKPKTELQGIEFKYIPPSGEKSMLIETDRVRLQQVITNLLNNALKFTPNGFIHFGFESKKDEIQFFVKDSGIGIAPEHQNLIFDRFRQVDEGSSRNYGGTGLGLAISKALVENLGGKIWLESKVEQGSTFIFTIPKKVKSYIDSNKSEKISPKIESKKNATVLIVDDEEMNSLFLREILEFQDIKSLIASNGEMAIELVKKHPEISLVLMDIKMPIMNGYIATKKIKKIKPELPIIAQTAYAMQGDREKAIDAGCDDYISKPIQESILNELLSKFLK